jgi:ribosomal protein S18 acetylase RimI-like enzyme
MHIIYGTQRHIEDCLSIGRELPGYFPEAGIAAMARDLREHRLYIAMDADQAAGFASIQIKTIQVAEISWMAVRPERRRQGVGTHLINQIVVDLTAEGLQLLEVKTLADTVDYPPYEQTRRFYEARGFVHLETIDPYPAWEPGNPCAIYVKVL